MKKILIKFRKLITSILLIAVFSLAYLIFFDKNIQEAGASWWNDSWTYRKSIQVTNNTTEETNVYISLTIDTSATSTIQSDCGDLRFTKTNGELLEYYIVSGCETATTIIHVNFPTLEINEQSIYYYYGNESADNGFSLSNFATEASDYTIGAVSSEEVGPGPVGYWSFNEGYGSTAHDESSGGNDGTITGATWKGESECVSGKCLYFDGVDETRVETDVQDNMKEFTACTWFKANSLTNIDSDTDIAILSKQFYLGFDNSGKVDFYVKTSASYPTVSSSKNITINKWYYICGIYYGLGVTEPKMFINGVDKSDLEFIGEGIQLDDSDTLLNVGSLRNEYARNFHGYIDEVKIYPYARTADQIKQDYNAGLAGVETSHGASVSFGSENQSWLSDGLVGYWKMDESATTTGAIDSSGNGNDGTYEGTASTTGGKFGRGGVFDGDSDYVDIITDDFLSTNITVSAWVKPNDISGSEYILCYGTGSDDRFCIGKGNDDFFIHDDIDDEGDTHTYNMSAFTIGEWSHVIVIIKDDGTKEGYLDGIYQGKDTSGNNWTGLSSGSSLLIGRLPVPSESYFNGKIDEVRIYNRALSKSEVQKLYEWAPGPVMHLKMDEKSGSTVYDVSGNENNGTINGAVSAQGKYGSAFDFDGVDDYIEIDDDVSLGLSQIGTISFWAKVDNWSEEYEILFKKGNGIGGWCNNTDEPFTIFNHYSGDIVAFSMCDGIGGMNQSEISPRPSTGEWHYYTFSWDGSSLNGYLDGNLEDSDSQSIDMTIDTDSFFMGGLNTDDNFDGQIDDVRIYNYARTQKQILEDMHNGDPMRGAVLDLSFDKGFGETAYDNSIFENNGTLYPGTGGTNTATSAMWSLEGKSGGAMEFDGVDDYVVITDQTNLDSTIFSVSLWVNPDAVTDQSIFISNIGEDSPWEGWALWMDRGLLGCDTGDICLWTSENSGGNYGYADYAYDFPLGEWTNWLVTYDDSNKNVKFYINNKEVFSDTVDYSPVFSGDEVVTVGGLRESGYKFDGEMDDIKMWSYVLSEEEIAKVYNSGKAVVMGSGSTESDGVTKTSSKNREYCIPGDTATCDPPVLELKMDKKSGSIAYDTSGNGNDGTISGATHSQGKLGAGLSFDGSDDYVDVSCSVCSVDMYPTTLSFWFNADDLSGIDLQVLVSYPPSDLSIGFSGGDYLHIGPTGHRRGVDISLFSPGEWYYFTAVYKAADDMQVYINGIDRTVVTNDYWLNDPFRIGMRYNSPFDGKIDDFRMYDYVRTPAQISYDYNKGKPIAHYSFNECSGSIIHDESGNGNHGTLNLGFSGAIATGTCASSSDSFWYNGRNGKINNSGWFGGGVGGDYVNLGDVSILEGMAQVTVSSWVKLDAIGGGDDYMIGNAGGSGGARYFLGKRSDRWNFTAFTASPDNTYINSSLEIEKEKWVHVLGVYNGSDLKLYIDGEQDINAVASGTPSGAIDSSSGHMILGARSDYADFMDGQIDEVKIWNYALTDEQVRSEYGGGAVRFGL